MSKIHEGKYRVCKNIIFDTLNEETGLVIDSKNNSAYEVTETVCAILKYIGKGETFNRIKEKIMNDYEVDEKKVESDLNEILEDLLKYKIIEKI